MSDMGKPWERGPAGPLKRSMPPNAQRAFGMEAQGRTRLGVRPWDGLRGLATLKALRIFFKATPLSSAHAYYSRA